MTRWMSAWSHAVADVRAFENSSEDVTLRVKLQAAVSGEELRVEFSNRHGTEPLILGSCAVGVGTQTRRVLFNGGVGATVPAGATRWSDAVKIQIETGDELIVDYYLPTRTVHSTGNYSSNDVEYSVAGDHTGADDFAAVPTPTLEAPDGSAMAIPVPFLRSVEVATDGAADVVVCLGDSITAGGWPQMAAALLSGHRETSMVNRGIAGNRLRQDPTPEIASFGVSGLTRFDDDVLGTTDATHVVIALGTNDLGLPGDVTPLEELPSADQMILAYQQLVDRAAAAGLTVILATITPAWGADNRDQAREDIRLTVNDWIRGSCIPFVDFDAAVRTGDSPARLAPEYDCGDHLHPNETGEQRLARAIADVLLGETA